jgi:hypothetical protein
LKSFFTIFVTVLTLTLTACSPAVVETKSTLKACELQKELSEYSFAEFENGNVTPEVLAEILRKSLVIAQTAEEADALPFEYQSDFFALLADPNSSGDFEPSQEMADANLEIALICQTYGILF